MKMILFSAALAVLAFVSFGLGQSVVVTGSKVTYKRPKPISDFKHTFTINYPKIKAATPALSRKIEQEISYFKAFDFTVRDEQTEVQWLEEADYEVLYNEDGILSIVLSINGSGAYPDGTDRNLVIDTRRGTRVRPAEVFTNLSRLSADVNKRLQAEIVDAKKEIKADKENGDVNPDDLFDGKVYSLVDLNEFTVTGKGVTFYFDYGFPHVIQALEPSGTFEYSWAQLKPFVRRGGLLHRFVR